MVPGGVNESLTAEKRDEILAMIPEGLAIAQRSFEFYKGAVGNFADEVNHFGTFHTLFLSLNPTPDFRSHPTPCLRESKRRTTALNSAPE